MALTVEETEVTATPDAMVARCNSRVTPWSNPYPNPNQV